MISPKKSSLVIALLVLLLVNFSHQSAMNLHDKKVTPITLITLADPKSQSSTNNEPKDCPTDKMIKKLEKGGVVFKNKDKIPSCPSQDTIKALMESGTVTIENTKTSNNPENTATFTQTFKQMLPKSQKTLQELYTLFSLTSFNTNIQGSLYFKIQKTQVNRNGFKFDFKTSSNVQWSRVRLSFMLLNRPDIEVGTASYDMLSSSSVPGKIMYQMKNQWKNNDYLRVNAYLSEFDGQTNSTHLGYILTGKTIQNDLLIFSYTANRTTQIQKITLSIIIFQYNNPAIRFAEGSMTETYLRTVSSLRIPQKVDGQTRRSISGLTSFVVENGMKINLVSNFSKGTDYLMAVGPDTDSECVFNYISFAFLIMSVNKCGFCKGKYYIYNDQCLTECPFGTRPNEKSECQKITCQEKEFLNSSNVCQKCPKRSNIPECDNSCAEDENLVGQQCIPKCDSKLNIVYFNGKCVCQIGYFDIQGKCGKCEEGTRYSAITKDCRSVCQSTFVYDKTLKTCVCQAGLVLIGRICSVCKEFEKYLADSKECVPKCTFPQVYNPSNDNCVCAPNFNRNFDNICIRCPVQQKFDAQTKRCKDICTEINTVYNNGNCICKPNYYTIKGACGQCPSNLIYDKNLQICRIDCRINQKYEAKTDKCICIDNYNLISGTCGKCPFRSTYDSKTQTCICIQGYLLADNNVCRIICSENQIERNGVCVCQNGYYLINDKCDKCPAGTQFDFIFKICHKPCLANQVYSLSDKNCICRSGYVIINGVCGKCPFRSNYNAVTQKCVCIDGYRLSNNQCVPICTDINEVYKNGICQCASGYYLIQGKCSTCPTATSYNSQTKTCDLICSKINEVFNSRTRSCECVSGYYIINGICGKCPSTKKYNSVTQTCENPCNKANTVYNVNTQTCVCAPNYYSVGGQCLICPPGFEFNTLLMNCVNICPKNERYDVTLRKCVCQQGYYTVKGECSKCEGGEVYDPRLQICALCPIQGKVYSIQKSKCVCPEGKGLLNGLCQDCGPHSFIGIDTEACFCKPGFVKINNECSKCPSRSVYDQTKETCVFFCPTNQIMVNGKCECKQGGYILWKGQCIPGLKCPTNSMFQPKSFCCLCNPGYILSGYQCLPRKVCGSNSQNINGVCDCNNGFNMVGDKCVTCRANEVYNGFVCMCKEGFTRNWQGVCSQVSIPRCKTNQYFNTIKRKCMCSGKTQFIYGQCQNIPNCPYHSSWNGRQCQCDDGYTLSNGKCSKNTNPTPQCPSYASFNGLNCECDKGYYPINAGSCSKCPSDHVWNGQTCSLTVSCLDGFAKSPVSGQCIPVGQLCGPNAQWNGISCCCIEGYNNVNKRCIKCEQGTAFDGSSCSTSSIAIETQNKCRSNQILVNNKCICVAGLNDIKGVCTKCPDQTFWNGIFCQPTVGNQGSWCMGRPFSKVVNGNCVCQHGYILIDQVCVKK